MIYVSFVAKSSGDRKFTIYAKELQAQGILSKRAVLHDGDLFDVKLVAINGAVVAQQFKASRTSSTNPTLMATDLVSEYLFGTPQTGSNQQVGICGFARAGAKSAVAAPAPRARVTTTQTARNTSSSSRNNQSAPSKTALKNALRQTGGNKSAAAANLGTNPRTFGRWLEAAGL